jgi:hypothetical protein
MSKHAKTMRLIEAARAILAEGQILGGALLDAEARMGELLKERPEVLPSRRGSQSPLPEGITKKLSHYCQQLAARIANMRSGMRTDLEPSADLHKVSAQEAADLLNVGRSVQKNY